MKAISRRAEGIPPPRKHRSYLRMRYISFLLFIVFFILSACNTTPPPNDSGFTIATPVPTLDVNDPVELCAAIAIYWDQDWAMTLRVLEMIDAIDATCDENFNIAEHFYTVHIKRGARFEQRQQPDEAVLAYQQALTYKPNDEEALEALAKLGVHNPEPLRICDRATVQTALNALPDYTPVATDFVQIEGNQLVLKGERYPIYGVNYYPRDYPYQRFLTEMEVVWVDTELSLIREAGINTLRIFLRHDDLFQCPGNATTAGAIPIPENFERLDGFIQFAASQGYTLILVMNQDADLVEYPLYDAPEHTMQQMAFIAQRYRDEAAVMAYDLRDGGDLDYLDALAPFDREDVLNWLSQAAMTVRQVTPNQLITAGWDNDAAGTASLVDFVSFQHFGHVDALRQEIAILKDATDKPILLSSVGYSTYEMEELMQRQAFQRAFEAVEQNGLMGWIVWTAFDYPLTTACMEPNCPAENDTRVRFGLWNTSYFPKRSVDIVRIVTGVAASDDDTE